MRENVDKPPQIVSKSVNTEQENVSQRKWNSDTNILI